jgi:D-alanine-D-alanine ligase
VGPFNQPDQESMTSAGTRLRVAVVFGGVSSEHGISCVSAGNVLGALDRQRYEVVAVGIDRDGRWHLVPDDPALYRIVDGHVPQVPAEGEPVVLPPDPTVGGLTLRDHSVVPLDVVFPVLHGPGGEDGTIQGVCELAGIACVGSDVAASAVCMDKLRTKAAATAAGIPVGAYIGITDDQWRRDPQECLARAAELGFPLFVKPARAGSSVGISKVHEADQLTAAIDEARAHDLRVIVEAAIADAREIECKILMTPEGPQASPCAQIEVLGHHEFYDFEAKYLDNSARITVPADLTAEESDAIQALSLKTFEALGCAGMARIDVFLTADGDVLLNEPNTIPGFTTTSMYPALWQAAGLSYTQLLDTLIADARQRMSVSVAVR